VGLVEQAKGVNRKPGDEKLAASRHVLRDQAEFIPAPVDYPLEVAGRMLDPPPARKCHLLPPQAAATMLIPLLRGLSCPSSRAASPTSTPKGAENQSPK
jgi:hypothetical protein